MNYRSGDVGRTLDVDPQWDHSEAIDILHPQHPSFEITPVQHSIFDVVPDLSSFPAEQRRYYDVHRRSRSWARPLLIVALLGVVSAAALLAIGGRSIRVRVNQWLGRTAPASEPDSSTAIVASRPEGSLPLSRALVAAEPAAEPPPHAAAPASTVDTPSSAPAAASKPIDSASNEAIQGQVNLYLHALSTLDVTAAKAVWPSLNETELRRTFASLDEQHLELSECQIAAAGEGASALCSGVTRYVPKGGTRTMFVQRRQWRFLFSQDHDRWVIDDVQVR